MITGDGTLHLYPGMSLLGVTAEPWPEGVVFRALTCGWATTDVRDDQMGDADEWATHVLSARCTGQNCGFEAGGTNGHTFTFNAADGVPHEYTAARFGLQTDAQRHAEECRSMRKPA